MSDPTERRPGRREARQVNPATIFVTLALAVIPPGVLVNPAVTQPNLQTTVCRPGWTATQRHVSARTKTAIYVAAGIPTSRRRYWVIDHVIPLEIGGSNNRANLAAQRVAEAARKDVYENRAHRAVRAGRVTLIDAQAAFATDWRTFR